MTAMQLGTAVEIEILKMAVEAGVFLGIIYDLLAVVRRGVRIFALRFACDFLYAVMFGAVFFVFSLAQTNYVRGFIFAAMSAGAVMWHIAFGRLLIFVICVPFRLIKSFLSILLRNLSPKSDV